MNEKRAVIRAVCISEKKGEQKHAVDRIMLRPGHGIVGDAHAQTGSSCHFIGMINQNLLCNSRL